MSNKAQYEKYILWNFAEIKKLIDRLPVITNDKIDFRKRLMQYATAYMISFRDEFEMQSWGNKNT